MNFLRKITLFALVAFIAVFSSCDKTKPYDVATPPPLVHFIGGATQIYSLLSDTVSAYKIHIGTTDVASTDRIVTYNVISTSGAAAGTQYSLVGGNTVTIPANSTRADILIKGNFPEYASGRRDTLIVSLSKPSIDVAGFQDTLKLVIAGPSGCSEDNISSLDALLGDYMNTNETLDGSPYGPYTTSISAVNLTSPTTGTIVVENIFDNGWGPITFQLDWTDPVNRTTTVVPQAAIPGSDAGDLSPTYAGQTIAVRPYATSGPGTYSFCDQTFTLNMQLGVTNVGYFNILYQLIVQR